MRIATGTYIGDGALARRIVTGLSGAVVHVRIVGVGASNPYCEKPASLPGAVYYDLSGGAGSLGCSIDGPDCVVDDNASPTSVNFPGQGYYWTAWSE